MLFITKLWRWFFPNQKVYILAYRMKGEDRIQTHTVVVPHEQHLLMWANDKPACAWVISEVFKKNNIDIDNTVKSYALHYVPSNAARMYD